MEEKNIVLEKVRSNNKIWDNYYSAYQKDSCMPGVKYPNEHLVRFISQASGEAGRNGGKVLELGFGTAANMLMMREYGYKVLGLEVSQDAAGRAERLIDTKRSGDNLKVGVFDGTTLPVGDGTFDIITGLQCVYYNVDQEFFAKECSRVLKPGGRIFFSFFSRRHGYMNYIEGRPGSIIKFTEDHPNPRLRGLELFLFESKEQFEEIYGRYFDIEIGYEDFDLYPVFMSWLYLAGRKKPVIKAEEPFVKTEFSGRIETAGKEDINKDVLEKMNIELWNKKYAFMYEKNLCAGNRYPNEYLLRFLATRERRLSGALYHNIGREDDVMAGRGEKVLELLPLNTTNLRMAAGMGFEAHGLTFCDTVLDNSKKAVRDLNIEGNVVIDKLDSCRLPYEDRTFTFIVTEKMASYFMDQEDLISEVSRIIRADGEIFIGYLSLRHEYLRWTEPIGGGYYRITSRHPDRTMRGISIYVPDEEALKNAWSGSFEAEIKHAEFNLFRYFSSFQFVKAKRRGDKA